MFLQVRMEHRMCGASQYWKPCNDQCCYQVITMFYKFLLNYVSYPYRLFYKLFLLGSVSHPCRPLTLATALAAAGKRCSRFVQTWLGLEESPLSGDIGRGPLLPVRPSPHTTAAAATAARTATAAGTHTQRRRSAVRHATTLTPRSPRSKRHGGGGGAWLSPSVPVWSGNGKTCLGTGSACPELGCRGANCCGRGPEPASRPLMATGNRKLAWERIGMACGQNPA